MTTYRVVLEGTTLPGFAPDNVRQRLAALVGRSEEVAARLLRGSASNVKSNIDEATGLRYVEALRKIGVACRLEPETLELDLPLPQATGQIAPASAPVRRTPDGRRTAKRSLTYALIASLVVVAYLLFGMLTQLLMAVLKWEQLPLLLGFVFVPAAVVFGVMYFVFSTIEKRFGLHKGYATTYKPSRSLVIVATLLVTASATYSALQSYSVGRGELDAATKQQEAAEKQSKIARDAAANSQRERDARLAGQMAEFSAQRTAIIAKAKQLNAAGKYPDALELGSEWLFIGDKELDAQTDLAREKVAAQTERDERARKNAGLQRTDAGHKRGICGEIVKLDLLLYENPRGHEATANCSYTDERLLITPRRSLSEERAKRFVFLVFVTVGSLRNEDFMLPENVYAGRGTDCQVMLTNDAAALQREAKYGGNSGMLRAMMWASSAKNVACPK